MEPSRYRTTRSAKIRAKPHSFALICGHLRAGDEFSGWPVQGGRAARSTLWIERALGGFVHSERLEQVDVR